MQTINRLPPEKVQRMGLLYHQKGANKCSQAPLESGTWSLDNLYGLPSKHKWRLIAAAMVVMGVKRLEILRPDEYFLVNFHYVL